MERQFQKIPFQENSFNCLHLTMEISIKCGKSSSQEWSWKQWTFQGVNEKRAAKRQPKSTPWYISLRGSEDSNQNMHLYQIPEEDKRNNFCSSECFQHLVHSHLSTRDMYHIRQNGYLIYPHISARMANSVKEKWDMKRILATQQRKHNTFFILFNPVSALTMPQKIGKPWGKRSIQRISWSSATY